MRPIILGILAAFFFAFTFVLNRSMELSGGSWIWSASLRYFFMLPFLFLIVGLRRNWSGVKREIAKSPTPWLVWSFVGFVLFYGPLSFAAAYGPGWLIAGTWQITIVSGSLLAPLFIQKLSAPGGDLLVRGKIPVRGLFMSLIILVGIILMQAAQAQHLSTNTLLLSVIPVLVASFAYPLGNRKMMELVGSRLDTYQRVLGMTLMSMPFWIILAIYGVMTVGWPSWSQTFQAFIVAVSSGVIATVLFFQATDLVKGDMAKLAAVEATQAGEVLFAAAGEIIFLSAPLPSGLSTVGLLLVIGGMVLHSWVSGRTSEPKNRNTKKAADLG
ncbi:multidrug resistance efflux transporter family protein [Aciduricibacillus chroicocephali]|uniref:Multidrug resistance efflux transporter family protein n=1 Tax=Aciduricibacillus chroicocephali TaxID=3054939 RepID=A0ABY9KVY2_9BACI|nr:multidrug resistance efflux transporter family protein [Bacillaceae bacterium 44XB]